ncbi:hypothetical protein OROHE_020516 [Orobanche hederae]
MRGGIALSFDIAGPNRSTHDGLLAQWESVLLIITLVRLSCESSQPHQCAYRQHGILLQTKPNLKRIYGAIQVMTNGRFLSVKHRVSVQLYESRMFIAYFAAPPLHAAVSCLLGVATVPLYKSFTWGEYKQAAYTRRLGGARLNLFTSPPP